MIDNLMVNLSQRDISEAHSHWSRHFRTALPTLPVPARNAPHRAVLRSNASGAFELYAWDRRERAGRQLTCRPGGTPTGAISPDGEWIWWFDDDAGNERGVWRRQPFADGPDEPAVPELGPAHSGGLVLGDAGLAVVGTSTSHAGFTVHAVRPGQHPKEIYQHSEPAFVSAISYDDSLIALKHSEHGNVRHPGIRVMTVDGFRVADLDDNVRGGPGMGLRPVGFAPLTADARLLLQHQRRGRWEPLVWDAVTGEEIDPVIHLDGDLEARWYGDGTALLLIRTLAGRSDLWRYELSTQALSRLATPPGTIHAAAAYSKVLVGIPAGTTASPALDVEYLWSSAERPHQVRTLDGTVIAVPGYRRTPPSVAVRDAWVPGPGGKVHALVHVPPGSGPFATVFELHGGPTQQDSDAFSARPAAWIDNDFAVVRVNYRGSTGYGKAWTDALRYRVGLIELEDVAAVREWAVAEGFADPGRLVLAGSSWGGYLTLLGLGVQPDAWAAGVASAPIADYLSAYDDEMESLRALDRALFGGSPVEVPGRYQASSPLTYVSHVRAPLYISAGVNDERCPLRQIENYVRLLDEMGKPYEFYRYEEGHGSLVAAERIKQFDQELSFVSRHLPGQVPADGRSGAAT
ncbi:prolyl oligopeptidase family serine peptidase [Actinoplanes sp. NPDC049316]|uniref:S9 family peptidase n=1 Tax=Actinoplanes sp. NPDC049316 TaxID=3154727 RepID=UPI003422CB2A